MALSIEFRGQWYDKNGVVHKVEIERDAVVSVSTIQFVSPTPVILRRRSTKTDGDIIVSGSELSFKFFF